MTRDKQDASVKQVGITDWTDTMSCALGLMG